jgi:hypothetical protein
MPMLIWCTLTSKVLSACHWCFWLSYIHACLAWLLSRENAWLPGVGDGIMGGPALDHCAYNRTSSSGVAPLSTIRVQFFFVNIGS